MKGIFLTSLTLLAVLLVNTFYYTSVIISIFPEEQRDFLMITSNISSIVNSIIGLAIYAVIFFLAYSLGNLTKIRIDRNIYLDKVFNILILITIIEIAKLAISFLFLKDDLAILVPDDTIATQLESTNWKYLINSAEIFFITVLPFLLFYFFREEDISIKNSLLSSFYIYIGFLLANFI